MSNAATDLPARNHVPGEPDIWVFVLFEAFLFTAYFAVYMFCRTQDHELFLHSQAQLNPAIGLTNTLILLVSSWSMARCVQAAREGDFQAALRNVHLTIALGLAFLALKVFEWVVEIREGLYFDTNEFFSFYYFLTSIHFIHLLIGFVFLGVVVYQLCGPARRSQRLIETGATYWHMVDFLWVNIFALLYVIR